jgi:phage shock protein E
MFQIFSSRNLKWYLPGIILGAIAGYIYYYFWGCNGSCMISSSPVNSMLYGATMGGLLNSMLKPETKKSKQGEE